MIKNLFNTVCDRDYNGFIYKKKFVWLVEKIRTMPTNARAPVSERTLLGNSVIYFWATNLKSYLNISFSGYKATRTRAALQCEIYW